MSCSCAQPAASFRAMRSQPCSFEREATPYDRFLDVHISHLRKKLESGRGLIRTIRGVGYVFTGSD